MSPLERVGSNPVIHPFANADLLESKPTGAGGGVEDLRCFCGATPLILQRLAGPLWRFNWSKGVGWLAHLATKEPSSGTNTAGECLSLWYVSPSRSPHPGLFAATQRFHAAVVPGNIPPPHQYRMMIQPLKVPPVLHPHTRKAGMPRALRFLFLFRLPFFFESPFGKSAS